MKAHGFFLYGMWGPVTDPGARTMTQRMVDELPDIDMHGSPYRDYDVNAIVSIIMGLPENEPVLVTGTSLGSNNTPVVAAYAYLQSKQRVINGIWGFQASIWGAQACDPATGSGSPDYPGITPNVKFAHLAYSLNPLNAGLGAYIWKKAPGNTVTNYYAFDTMDIHPGDGNVNVQNMFIDEMKRVIESAQ
jgi:hypothetical protein